MIFARRALQRRLNELRPVLGDQATAKLAERLNRPGRDRVAAMWEVAVLHGLSQLGTLHSDPRVVDLYTDVVRPLTEWPLSSYGIKLIAKSCGFSWRAEDASGASSIAWYDAYVRTGDAELRERIVDYNQSDCIASAVLLDALIALPVGPPIERRWWSAGEGVVAQPG